jgi:hypothetical protein
MLDEMISVVVVVPTGVSERHDLAKAMSQIFIVARDNITSQLPQEIRTSLIGTFAG